MSKSKTRKPGMRASPRARPSIVLVTEMRREVAAAELELDALSARIGLPAGWPAERVKLHDRRLKAAHRDFGLLLSRPSLVSARFAKARSELQEWHRSRTPLRPEILTRNDERVLATWTRVMVEETERAAAKLTDAEWEALGADDDRAATMTTRELFRRWARSPSWWRSRCASGELTPVGRGKNNAYVVLVEDAARLAATLGIPRRH